MRFSTHSLITHSYANLLQELEETSGELVRHLADDGVRLARPAALTEAEFRWQHNEDAMATEKLAEGIRAFDADTRRLAALIADLPA